MLYVYTGQVRNGKTISVIVEGKNYYDEGYSIYSNIKLSYPYKVLTRKMILEWEKVDLDLPDKTMFIIDEIHAWFDSRNSANSNNKVFSYFITQLGKFTSDKQKGLTILGTTQFFSQIDVRGRRITYMIIECKKLDEQKDSVTVLRTYKRNDNLVLHNVKREVVKFDKTDFELYDTQEKVRSERD